MIAWAKRQLGGQGAVVVLTFHRVLPDDSYAKTLSPAGMVVRERTFEESLRFLARRYQLLNLAQGGPQWSNGSRKLRVAVTFDDGWIDNGRVAFPIARKHGVPLTIFVCTGSLGQELPFWPEQVAALWRAAERAGITGKLAELLSGLTPGRQAECGQLAADAIELLKQFALQGQHSAVSVIELLKQFSAHQRAQAIAQMAEIVGAATRADGAVDATMSWPELDRLAQNGVTFGSHTHSHQILTRVAPPDACRELAESKHVLEQRLGKECAIFSYPNGDWSREVRDLVARAGYKLAFLNEDGVWTSQSDPWLIPRVNLWEGSLTGPSGRFSRMASEYSIFWKAYRAPRPEAARKDAR